MQKLHSAIIALGEPSWNFGLDAKTWKQKSWEGWKEQLRDNSSKKFLSIIKSSFWWVWHIAKLDFKFKLKRYLKVHWAIFCVIWNLRGHMRNKFASIIDSITSELISIWRPLAISLLKTTYLEFCDIHDGCKNLKWWLFFKRPFPLLQYLTLFAPRLGPGGQICSHPVQTYVPEKINGWQLW